MSIDLSVHVDVSWLSKWINPAHLAADALAGYRENFRAESAPHLRLDNFLQPVMAQMLGDFLSREAEYEMVYGVCATEESVSENEWAVADESARLYRFKRLKGMRSDVRSLNPIMFNRFRDFCRDSRTLAYYEHLTGVVLGSGQTFAGNAFGVGDYLRPHNDVMNRRRLAYIIYLNPRWQPSFGGGLHILANDGNETVLEVEYNSLVVFDVHEHVHHYVAPIHESAGTELRTTLGGWIDDPE